MDCKRPDFMRSAIYRRRKSTAWVRRQIAFTATKATIGSTGRRMVRGTAVAGRMAKARVKLASSHVAEFCAGGQPGAEKSAGYHSHHARHFHARNSRLKSASVASIAVVNATR